VCRFYLALSDNPPAKILVHGLIAVPHSLGIFYLFVTPKRKFYRLHFIYRKGGDCGKESGNSEYPCFGDTGAAILQQAGELSSSTTENLLCNCCRTVTVSCLQCTPHLYVLRNPKFSQICPDMVVLCKQFY
jgi:hypothetical protein